MAQASVRNGGAWTKITDEEHRADTSAAHAASAIAFTPTGTIAATDVQAAIAEVASEAGGGGAAITVEDEGTPLATAAETLDFVGAGVTATGTGTEKTITIPGSAAHEADSSDAHDASAISVADAGSLLAATDVEAALAEIINRFKTVVIPFVISGAGSVIPTGIAGDLEIPFNCTITAARAFADQSGSVVVDIWKDSYANYPPTDADSITASAPVTISSTNKSQDTTLTGWTTSITAGQTLRFNVDSATTITRVTISLTVTRTT
jgi:hypothetical protein